MSRIGSRINSVRTAKGITQKQLAKMVGVAEKFIIEVESGKKVLSDDLIKRVSKALGEEISEMMLPISDVVPEKQEKSSKTPAKLPQPEVQKVWNDAFESVLKAVPVYDYSIDKVLHTKQLPVVSNKIDGYAKDKVLYLEIQDNDMIGFRIVKGDLAFAYLTGEVENNAVCLVEINGNRVVRQLKKLDSDKIMLLSNNGKMMTETVQLRSMKILARLVRLEVKL
ncbi:MAG: helix-turn-helix domain-containing protein [Clostridia bacterium]|nr:helix-turn-helix domain-containing protein [Clostridia bacterium]